MEEQTLRPAVAATAAATIAEAFRITVEEHPDRVAVRTKDDEVSHTWSELRDARTRSRAAWRSSVCGAATPSR